MQAIHSSYAAPLELHNAASSQLQNWDSTRAASQELPIQGISHASKCEPLFLLQIQNAPFSAVEDRYLRILNETGLSKRQICNVFCRLVGIADPTEYFKQGQKKIRYIRSHPVRDLTRYGIEPNPGPEVEISAHPSVPTPAFAFHGNYGGPNYTGGELRPVKPNFSVPPIDLMDSHYRDHDKGYGNLTNIAAEKAADDKLIEMIKKDAPLLSKHKLAQLAFQLKRAFNVSFSVDQLVGELRNPHSRQKLVRRLNRLKPRLVGVELNPGPPKKNPNKRPQNSKPRRNKNKNQNRKANQNFVAPVAQMRRMTIREPRVKYGKGTVTITHREYVGDVMTQVVDVDHTVYSLPIYPTNSALFKWLSVIAAGFEEYRFQNLKFSYETDVSTSTGGVVLSAIDYDAADAPPTNKSDISQMYHCVRSVPWQRADCHFNPKKANRVKWHINRNGFSNVPVPNIDYDAGMYHMMLSGAANSSVVWGELWVEYTVVMRTPAPNFNTGAETLYMMSAGTVTTLSPFSTTPTKVIYSENFTYPGRVVPTAAVSYEYLNIATDGLYQLVWHINGTGLTNAAPGNFNVGLDSHAFNVTNPFGAMYSYGAQSTTDQIYMKIINIAGATAAEPAVLHLYLSSASSFDKSYLTMFRTPPHSGLTVQYPLYKNGIKLESLGVRQLIPKKTLPSDNPIVLQSEKDRIEEMVRKAVDRKLRFLRDGLDTDDEKHEYVEAREP